MRLRITVGEKDEKYKFPWSYNYFIASSIYYLLRKYYPKYSLVIHTKGWSIKNKNLKLFTFSPFFPKKIYFEKEYILMVGPLTFLISSPDTLFIELLENAILKEKCMKFFRYTMPVLNVKVFEIKDLKKKNLLKTLSPVVISIKEKKGDRFYSVYISPESPFFKKRLKEIICLKFEAFTGEKISVDDIEIKTRNFSSKLLRIKSVNLKAYNAEIEVESDIQIIRFLIDSGLGEKTSMGFGMVEKLKA